MSIFYLYPLRPVLVSPLRPALRPAQINLANYDANKDKRFNGTIRLPVAPRGDRLTVCVLGTEAHIGEAKSISIDALVRREAANADADADAADAACCFGRCRHRRRSSS